MGRTGRQPEKLRATNTLYTKPNHAQRNRHGTQPVRTHRAREPIRRNDTMAHACNMAVNQRTAQMRYFSQPRFAFNTNDQHLPPKLSRHPVAFAIPLTEANVINSHGHRVIASLSSSTKSYYQQFAFAYKLKYAVVIGTNHQIRSLIPIPTTVIAEATTRATEAYQRNHGIFNQLN